MASNKVSNKQSIFLKLFIQFALRALHGITWVRTIRLMNAYIQTAWEEMFLDGMQREIVRQALQEKYKTKELIDQWM